jgi:hypothetical protein
VRVVSRQGTEGVCPFDPETSLWRVELRTLTGAREVLYLRDNVLISLFECYKSIDDEGSLKGAATG